MSTKIKALEALEYMRFISEDEHHWNLLNDYLQALPADPLEDGYYWANKISPKLGREVVRILDSSAYVPGSSNIYEVDEFENFVPVPDEVEK